MIMGPQIPWCFEEPEAKKLAYLRATSILELGERERQWLDIAGRNYPREQLVRFARYSADRLEYLIQTDLGVAVDRIVFSFLPAGTVGGIPALVLRFEVALRGSEGAMVERAILSIADPQVNA